MLTNQDLKEIFQDEEFILKAKIRWYASRIKNGEKSLAILEKQNVMYADQVRKASDEFIVYWCEEELKINKAVIIKVEKKLYFIKKQRLLLSRALKREREGLPPEPTQEVQVDLDELKKIPILQVLEMYGVEVDRFKHFKVRNEKTASCSYNETKNLWVDHGNRDYGGSVIDLIMILEGCSVSDSIKKLKEII